MYYPEETIEEVRRRSDIVDIIGSYVKLKRTGSNYQGLCPFHNEKTPSFSVNPSRQIYKCFGCGKAGNVITFVMDYENMSFPEALKYLADKNGIELPQAEYSEERQHSARIRAQLLDIYKKAAVYYFKNLRSNEGAEAYRYFKSRALSDETMKNFGLGYSPKSGSRLYEMLKKDGYSDEVIKASELFSYSEQYGARDKFWNRVMFPIMDVNNKVIAFGGRVMGDGLPKYLNSNETKIYEKSRHLYAMNLARKSRAGYLLLCEGYMDVIALHQAGFDNAVASLGTALTGLQANLISRYVKKVVITYDSDGAGTKAALRAIPILKEAGITAKVLRMTPYKDPDEFIKALGREEYEKRIENAISGFDFEILCMEREHDLDNADDKNLFINELVDKMLEYTDELERNTYMEAVAKKYKLDFDAFRQRVNKKGLKLADKYVMAVEPRQVKNDNSVVEGLDKTRLEYERLLFTWSMESTKFAKIITEFLIVDEFQEGIPRIAAGIAFDRINRGEDINPASIINYFETSEEQTIVSDLFQTELWSQMNDDTKLREKALSDTITRVKSISVNEGMKKASIENDGALLTKYLSEKKELSRLSAKINSRLSV